MDRRNFIQSLGTSATFIACSNVWSSCNNIADNNIEEELKLRSKAAFKRFEVVWNFNDFWKRGNTFDACLTFVDAVQTRWPDDAEVKEMQLKVKEMLEENMAFFNKYDPGSLWADDFGWWGLMALNARKHLLKMNEKDLAQEYFELSTDLCWEYKKKTAYDHTPDAIPVPHGCRNGDANGQSIGVKNTVTNVLLFLLSSRIYRVMQQENMKNSEKYLDMAYRQWLWFDQWFNLQDYEYIKVVGTDGALVQERPMACFEGSSYCEKIHPPWAEGWVWTGDQGMLIAALTDMLLLSDNVEAWMKKNNPVTDFNTNSYTHTIRTLLKKLGKGVKLAFASEDDGIIREAPCLSSFGPAHGRDYVAGRGILMRYIGSEDEKHFMGVNLNKNIMDTVQAIWDTRDTFNNQFQPEFTDHVNDTQYIHNFRKLWGIADDVYTWNLKKMQEKNKNGVCQAIGLDALGAAIKSL